MTNPRLTLCMLTLDRYDLMIGILQQNLDRCGIPYDLMIWDNGSQDERVINGVKELKPYVHVRGNKNWGVATGFNQLFLQRPKDNHVVLLGNDILLPQDWGITTWDYIHNVPGTGLAAFHCVEALHPQEEVNTRIIHPGGVFGSMCIHSDVFDKVGYFNEEFNPYGLEDSEFCIRVIQSGFRTYYMHNQKSTHHGHDVGQNSPYRLMKNKSLEANAQKYGPIMETRQRENNWYQGPPYKFKWVNPTGFSEYISKYDS